MVMAPGGFSKPENSRFFDQKMALGENRQKNVFFDLKTCVFAKLLCTNQEN